MISIVISALNEEAYMRTCLEALRQDDDTYEIIVADGGSTDRTIEIVEGFQGVKVLSRVKGAEKTLHDDIILICIHLTATSQSV